MGSIMSFEKIGLVYIPNDFRSTFQCDDPTKKKDFEFKKSSFTKLDCFYSWMLERGTFYKFFMDNDDERMDLERVLGLLSALNIPAIVIKDITDIVNLVPEEIGIFSFENFSRHILSIWFSSKLSLMFDKKDIISIEDFSFCPICLGTDLKSCCVNVFDTLERFEERFFDFLLTYKSIESRSFYIYNEEDLPW